MIDDPPVGALDEDQMIQIRRADRIDDVLFRGGHSSGDAGGTAPGGKVSGLEAVGEDGAAWNALNERWMVAANATGHRLDGL